MIPSIGELDAGARPGLLLRLLSPERISRLAGHLRRRPEVQALTYAVLADHGALCLLSREAAAIARRAYVAALDANLRRLRRLDRLLDGWRAEGVPVVVVKGGLLCRTHYGDPGARPMADLDLLCRPADLERAAAVLRGQGFAARPRPAPRVAMGAVHDLQFVDGPVRIELHFRLWHELGLPSDAEPVMSRAVEVPYGSGHALGPAAADHLYLVLLHAATHGFTGNPLWLVDALLLAGDTPALWDEAWELARRDRATLALAAAIDQLRLVFPDLAPAGPSSAPVRRRLLRYLAPWLQQGEARHGRWGSRMARLLLVDDPSRLGRWALGKARLLAAGE